MKAHLTEMLLPPYYINLTIPSNHLEKPFFMRIISILISTLFFSTLLLLSCEKQQIQDASVETITDANLVKPQNKQDLISAEQFLQEALETNKRTQTSKSETTCCEVVSFSIHPYSTPTRINLKVRYHMNQPTQQLRI
mgnify:FL=1